MNIRPLRADEVNCRLSQCIDGKAQFLLYVDSRACRKILDETFGVFGWQDRYSEVKGALYCTIDIWDPEKKQWISKQDGGTESFAEKTKGEASDAFKRACFCAGIGRELYTKIPIWIAMETVEKETGGRPKYQPKKRDYLYYRVARIETNRMTQKIRYLCIVNQKCELVFEWGFSDMPYINDEAERARDAILSYCEEYSEITGADIDKVVKATMKGIENSAKGYAEAILKIKKEIETEKDKKDQTGSDG